MKIIQINVVYKTGSTGKIVSDLHSYFLEAKNESYVFYGRGKRTDDKNVYKIKTEFGAKIHSFLSLLFGKEFGYSIFSTNKAIKLIKKIKPDVVHLHCLNGHFINVYKLINFLKKSNIKTILTLHAEIMYTAGCDHALSCEKWKKECNHCEKIRGVISHYFRDDALNCFRLMRNAFEKFNNLTVVGCSNWIKERAQQSVIFSKSYCTSITNGIDVSSFKFYSNTNLKEKLGIEKNKKIILHVTPNFNLPIKGSNFLLELVKMMPDYQFIVVGGKENYAIPNLMFVGKLTKKEDLAAFYSISDCLAMTSYRETYPTVCLEAISCNLNIVGFKSGGIPEIIPYNMGECVEPYDIVAFKNALIKWSNVSKKNVTTVKNPMQMAEEYLLLYGAKNENKT